ncbi:MAG: SUMF1/EgtB/PvdO family nonheme iron enzyme, partial [Candidatus Poribacteria bacterium]|nr:SUMF1/EgtB/PvdO family nonheme iron enzyme [Candidatus Poribacteria bacterium]
MKRSPRLTTALLSACIVAVFATMLSANAQNARGFLSVVGTSERTQESVQVSLYRKMVAVVIGIDRYADPTMNLEYAVRDAMGVRDTLDELYTFDSIDTLFNEQATRANILSLLMTTLPQRVSEDDAVLIFFSGHGNTVDTATGPLGYLVPHDGASNNPVNNISMSQLRDDVSRTIPARHLYFIVDACYGGLLTRSAGTSAPQRNIDYLQSIAEKPARQVLTAGDTDQQVLDGGPLGHSVFTGRLIEALRNATDYITASELARDVKEKVFTDAEARGHKQTPLDGYLSGTGDFVFIPKRRNLLAVQREIAELEAQLEASRRDEENAARQNNERRQAEELQRQAETAEKLRQAREAERLERERQARAAEAAEAKRLADQRSRQTEQKRLDEERRLAELRRLAEEERLKRESERAGMTLHEAVIRHKELRERIAEVEAQVRAEVEQDKKLIRPPDIRTVDPKDEFETTAEYDARRKRLEEGNAQERDRHRLESAAADANLPDRIAQATDGFRKALDALVLREYPLSADKIAVKLGDYDADRGLFAYEITLDGIPGLTSSGILPVPRDSARALRDAEQGAALIVAVTGKVGKDGAVSVGVPSFGAPNLPDRFPGKPGVLLSPEAQRLIAELTAAGTTDRRRLDIGVRLAAIGDTRRGVGVEKGVPDIDWVSVSPGGRITINGTSFEVQPFSLARYEITNAQFEAFVNASDGASKAAWWRGMPPNVFKTIAASDNPQPNAPKTNVTWYQAVAFTRWLNAQMKEANRTLEVRLPTEWEWQWAAQGGSETREYPWGDWRDGYANTDAGGLGKTTAVGMYPSGSSKSGALDMGGNVWEWCLNEYDAPYIIDGLSTNKSK